MIPGWTGSWGNLRFLGKGFHRFFYQQVEPERCHSAKTRHSVGQSKYSNSWPLLVEWFCGASQLGKDLTDVLKPEMIDLLGRSLHWMICLVVSFRSLPNFPAVGRRRLHAVQRCFSLSCFLQERWLGRIGSKDWNLSWMSRVTCRMYGKM